ncbi:MAG: hypothetical protein ACP6IS_02590 [Candidatus Asgardarchaeia archaeon]
MIMDDFPIWASNTEGEKIRKCDIRMNNIYGLLFDLLIILSLFGIGHIIGSAFGHPFLLGTPILAAWVLMMMIILSASLTMIFGKRYITSLQFFLLYDDEIIIHELYNIGLVRLPRSEYYVDIIAYEHTIPELEKLPDMYIVLNKPARGTSLIPMLEKLYLDAEKLRSFIEVVKPHRVLLDGYYYPSVYAVFRDIYGEDYPELAKALLKDFSGEVNRYGLNCVTAIMYALKSLCLARRDNDAIKLAKAIVDGTVFESEDIVEVVDEQVYWKWASQKISINTSEEHYEYRTHGFEIVNKIDNIDTVFLFSLVLYPFIVLFLFNDVAMLYYTIAWLVVVGMADLMKKIPLWSRVSIKSGINKAVSLVTLFRVAVMSLLIPLPWLSNLPRAIPFTVVVVAIATILSMVRPLLTWHSYFLHLACLKNADRLLSKLDELSTVQTRAND